MILAMNVEQDFRLPVHRMPHVRGACAAWRDKAHVLENIRRCFGGGDPATLNSGEDVLNGGVLTSSTVHTIDNGYIGKWPTNSMEWQSPNICLVFVDLTRLVAR